GTAGPDNDLLENLAKLQPFQASKLYLQNENADGGRVQRTAESVTFGVFRPSVGLITDLSGYESKVGDYGIFVYNFGTAPFQLSTVQKSVFEFEMDTSIIPGDVAANVRVTVMGASDFSWDDGSRIL